MGAKWPNIAALEPLWLRLRAKMPLWRRFGALLAQLWRHLGAKMAPGRRCGAARARRFLVNFGSPEHFQFKCAPLAVRFCNFVVNYHTFLGPEKVSPQNKHILLYTPNWRAGTQFRVVWGRSIVGVRSLGGERGEHVTN